LALAKRWLLTALWLDISVTAAEVNSAAAAAALAARSSGVPFFDHRGFREWIRRQADDQASRKRCLLKGPEEFRELRVDRLKAKGK
jgi:hypothetical protein